MTEKGQKIYDKVLSALKAIEFSDKYFYGKMNTFNRLLTLTSCHGFDERASVVIGETSASVFVKFAVGGFAFNRFVRISINYTDKDTAFIKYGYGTAEFPLSYQNLFNVIDVFENISNIYMDENMYRDVVTYAVDKLKLEGVITETY